MTVMHHVYLASYDNAPRSSREALYHWALLIAPEDADTNSVLTTRMYHATKRGSHWYFEHRRVDSVRSPLMLGRVQFAYIDEEHLSGVVETLSDPRLIRPDERDWDCGTWARGELDGLFRFAEQFSEKVARNRTVVGFSAPPPTKRYHGPGRYVA